MIGVFDSGVGGLTAIAELRRLAPISASMQTERIRHTAQNPKKSC